MPPADSLKVSPPNLDSTKPTVLHFKNIEGELGSSSGSIEIGEIIAFVSGRFSSADRVDTAYVIKTKQGEGNPVEDGKPDGYTIRFTGSNKAIDIGCCDARLIKEGDLNNDGRDELSCFQYPENGCTTSFRTFTFAGDKWKDLIEMFLVPSACEPVSDSELQSKVFADGGVIYYMDMVDTTINDKDLFYPVKTRAELH